MAIDCNQVSTMSKSLPFLDDWERILPSEECQRAFRFRVVSNSFWCHLSHLLLPLKRFESLMINEGIEAELSRLHCSSTCVSAEILVTAAYHCGEWNHHCRVWIIWDLRAEIRNTCLNANPHQGLTTGSRINKTHSPNLSLNVVSMQRSAALLWVPHRSLDGKTTSTINPVYLGLPTITAARLRILLDDSPKIGYLSFPLPTGWMTQFYPERRIY